MDNYNTLWIVSFIKPPTLSILNNKDFIKVYEDYKTQFYGFQWEDFGMFRVSAVPITELATLLWNYWFGTLTKFS